jgi:mRNA-degrading endonuclease RelE of RelBE toxin-antitoxin system
MVLVERRAEKALRRRITRRIHPQAAERISKASNALAEDPYPKDSTRLTNAPGYRLKIGCDYWALYFVAEEKQVVSVTRVGTREGFYG